MRPHPLYPVPTSADPWTEEAWDKHVAELEKKHRPQLSPWVRALVVLLLISPSIAALGTAAWGKNLDAGAEVLGLFILLFLFAIAVAALASYVFEGSSQGYLDEGWDPGDGVNALLLLLGGLTLLLGDYPYWRGSWGSHGPWSWTRVWIAVISTVNFLAVFLCWLTVAVG